MLLEEMVRLNSRWKPCNVTLPGAVSKGQFGWAGWEEIESVVCAQPEPTGWPKPLELAVLGPARGYLLCP